MTSTNSASNKGHSEESFNEYRNYWWNADFLDLMAKRWELHNCRAVLDVGCGLCHWSLLLAEHLPTGAAVEGLDSDEKWATLRPDLAEAFSKRGVRLQLKQGSALSLPYEDNSFDLVTCQTLLIHLHDPQTAVEEMVRVVRPGGLVAVVEPNNCVFSLISDSQTDYQDIYGRLKLVEHSMIYELGKMNSGRGFNSIGDRVPELLFKGGLTAVRAYQSDKTSPLLPPYRSEEQQALVSAIEDWFQKKEGSYNFDEYSSAYLAAGEGYADKLGEHWALKERAHAEMMRTIRSGSYYSIGGCMMYLVSGHKPALDSSRSLDSSN